MSSDKLFIKNGQIVNHDETKIANIYAEDGIIKFVGKDGEFSIPDGCRVIDADGKFVIPGGIDPHTHFELELDGLVTVDDFFIGTRAAIAGGTTTIIDFIIPHKGESLVDAFKRYRNKADSKVCCDFAFHIAISWWSESVRNEMKTIIDDYGVNSFKCYMAYKDLLMLSDTEMYEVFETCKEVGGLAMVHAENGNVIAKNQEKLLKSGITGPEGHALSRSEYVEAEATHRACMIAQETKCPLYVVHVMSKAAADVIANAREAYGEKLIFAETLSSALGTDGSNYYHKCFHHAAGHVMSPPLRFDPTTKEYLMNMLKSNKLQVTGSDNCTFNMEHKALGKEDFTKIPSGINGVEDRMSVIWEKGVKTGIIDPQKFVEVTSTNAAKIFNLYPKKGRIDVGSDADIVIWNGEATRTISAKTHHQACDFNIFEGMTCHGVPDVVIVKGKICYENGILNVEKGFGKFLKTPAKCPYIYG